MNLRIIIVHTIFVIIVSLSSFASSIKIDTLVLDTFNMCNVPVAISNDLNDTSIINRINSAISNRFMFGPLFPDSIINGGYGGWNEVDFSVFIEDTSLWIEWTGEYYGAYPNRVNDDFFFSLTTGKLLIEENRKADFTPKDFFHKDSMEVLLNNLWTQECSASIDAAIECANGEEPDCRCEYPAISFTDTTMMITLEECYPRVLWSCSPYIVKEVLIKEIYPYLNSFGNKIIRNTDYIGSNKLGKVLLYLQYRDSIPDY